MVEEKRKRGRPKKNKESVLSAGPDMKESVLATRTDMKESVLSTAWDWEIFGNQRRDDLCVQMLMGIITKQGQIKYDFAKDIFDTATQLAYDFGWMKRPRAKKQDLADPLMSALNNPAYAVVEDDQSREHKSEALANTPADILRALREG